LITVKTYPLPSGKYDELVCTAGIHESGKWIRLYPIPFRALPYDKQYKKYEWIQLDLVRNEKDFRLESYRPSKGAEYARVVGKVTTGKDRSWRDRRKLVLDEVYDSMEEVISLAYGAAPRSLVTVQPREIVDFVIEEDEREWKPQWRDQLNQMSLFDWVETGEGQRREVVKKLPYKYYYRLLTCGDQRPRQLMIEDWEIGALYWNCLAQTEGDEAAANVLVKQKYFGEFLQKDLHLFLGTTLQFHAKRAPNPFTIIGVFSPPQDYQLGLGI
jgi:hypothetical protein